MKTYDVTIEIKATIEAQNLKELDDIINEGVYKFDRSRPVDRKRMPWILKKKFEWWRC